MFCQSLRMKGLPQNAICCVNRYISGACGILLHEFWKLGFSGYGIRASSSSTNGGLKQNTVLANIEIQKFIDEGSLKDAHKSFNSLSRRDVASWTTLIQGYAKHGGGGGGGSEAAMQLFRQMQWEGFEPNKVTFVSILNVCSNPAYVQEGAFLHHSTLNKGFNLDLFVQTSLIKMYSKCGSLRDAITLFRDMRNRDLVVWNTMIAAFAMHGYNEEAMQLFVEMKNLGVGSDRITFISLLESCATPEALRNGQLVHEFVEESRYKHDIVVRNALVKMYSKCDSLAKAQQSFDEMSERNVVSWTIIIVANAQHGLGIRSLMLFKMMQLEGVKPDKVAFVTVIDVCAQLRALEEGRMIHAQLDLYDLKLDVVVGTALMKMYGECGCLEECQELFDKISHHNVLQCWTVMIGICASHGQGVAAFHLFTEMQKRGMKADKIAFLSCIEACGNMTYLPEAKQIHSWIIARGLETDILVGNALVTMYSKCGCLEEALCVFKKLPERDVVSYNAIMTAYAQHGQGKAAIQVFGQMQFESVKPSDITFSSILFACSHSGLLEEGCQYFTFGGLNKDILHQLEHYGCMIDILGRAGQLSLAEEFICHMSSQPNEVLWTSLLNGCRIHGDIDRAERVVDQLLKLDPDNHVPYLLLLSMYSTAGRWDDASKLKRLTMQKQQNLAISVMKMQKYG